MVATSPFASLTRVVQPPAVCVRLILVAAISLVMASHSRALDQNGNQMSDIWEMIFNAQNVSANADSDLDGFTNFQEALAATDPFNPLSHPSINIMSPAANSIVTSWPSAIGKLYDLQVSNNLTAWQSSATFVGDGSVQSALSQLSGQLSLLFRISIGDQASENPQLTKWEKLVLGFDPDSAHTDRFDQSDLQRITAGIAANAPNIITVSAIKPEMSERWPEPGVITVRRSGGGLKPLTVKLAIGGTATVGVDYSLGNATTNSVFVPAGVREVWMQFQPTQDASDAEPTETISVTLQSDSSYSLGTTTSATINLANETGASQPSPKAAARFLIQAAFGPDGVKPSDSNGIPQNVAEVMQLGFAGWIDDQFTRPVCKLEPFVNYAGTAGILNGDNIKKQTAWWNRAMGVTKIRPDDANTVQPDLLRQRIGFALSQLFVVSDRPETLAVQPGGLANYYDMLLNDAFGSFRTLLFDVTLHPVMGVYLSHLLNKKAANNIFPDENYAREVMQLFSIGLWKLNQDGSRQLDGQGQPIPTYDNSNITEFARVFTGLGYAGNPNYSLFPQNFLAPMKLWDTHHDCNAKTLLNGVTLPLRTPSTPDVGTATLADINGAIDCLFNHPNVGPFIGRQLIQRLVTSNPSPAYISRVAAVFADNGQGVRGDMKAVIKAILLDTEARDPAMMSSSTFGKLREPFLRCVNLAHAFNASAQAGFYALDAFYYGSCSRTDALAECV